MRRATQFLQTAILIVLTALVLTGCNTGSREVRYINTANPSETLTLRRLDSTKTKLISAFHGVSTGYYTLKTEKGTHMGEYKSDSNGIKFMPDAGKAETVKIKDDGSFDFAQGTWAVTPVVMEKSLKALVSSAEAGTAQ